MAHIAGAYPGFCSINRLGVLLPPPPTPPREYIEEKILSKEILKTRYDELV